ncbi:hypothetical protein O3M35_007916 [Rhynocoris fuscipes]|uniref:Coiled-coil domain-containing protein 51 n=1 Tax=Rhynocoris fuscipes TaxID=488301 RepID=A0AAW1DDP4_9HEMI
MFRICRLSRVSLERVTILQQCRTFVIYGHKLCNSKEMISSSESLLGPNVATSKSNYVKGKFNDLVVWYEQLTGMDEVRMMQNRVIEAQDRFIAAQENRREVGKELARIQSKLKEIHSELDTTSRGEERYLQLITEEHAILKDERRLVTEFALLEREERESFSLLSACVKESHEKERAQAERTKYWSIIGSIIGTVIGVAGSSINNEFKMRELRKLVRESALRSTADTESTAMLLQHEQELSQLVNNMKQIIEQQTISNHGYSGDKSDVELDGKLERVLHSLQNVNSIASLPSQVEEMKLLLESAQRYDGQLVTIPQDMETMIIQQQREMRLIVIAVTVMGVIVPIIVTILSRS